ncbi:CsgE family curli-type amyloid fiber assembly protein [Modicisalibacter radicis]|uniref:CsgE family curli-type amyloid fiber assembly protein n=1 Tax=Halomonas sp. EAR18 TaxID=2518972 RepID=UPI00109C7938|nr:CsgE family curli-type amyloid fiber assembly protein [Halomonas sp. EAR18]
MSRANSPIALVVVMVMLTATSWAQDVNIPDPQRAASEQNDTPEGKDGPVLDDSYKPHSSASLSGLLIDRTITMIGKTFFRQFSQRRLDSLLLSDVSLIVHERPSARWGSLIWIAEDNRILYQATLPPRLSDVDQYATAAVEQVEQLHLQRKIMQALENNGDLAGDEW